MFIISPWTYPLAMSYVALGIFIFRRALTPSCRECLHRHRCPNRPPRDFPLCIEDKRLARRNRKIG